MLADARCELKIHLQGKFPWFYKGNTCILSCYNNAYIGKVNLLWNNSVYISITIVTISRIKIFIRPMFIHKLVQFLFKYEYIKYCMYYVIVCEWHDCMILY